jgi:hypothetical protein
MKKLFKAITTTAIFMAMSSSALIVSAQPIEIESQISALKQNQVEIEKQLIEKAEKQEVLSVEDKDSILLASAIDKMYTDTLDRIGNYVSITYTLQSDLQQYTTQLTQLNKDLKESEVAVKEDEKVQLEQQSQYEYLKRIEDVLQQVDQYLTNVENDYESNDAV